MRAINDTERRDVAARLRETERQTLCELTDGELIDFLVETVGFNRYTNEDFDEGLLGRIAELLAVADECDVADVDGVSDWAARIRKAVGE